MRARTVAAAGAVALAAAAGVLVSTSPSSASSDGVDRVRAATAQYHDIATARAAGFTELHDAADIACIDKAGAGGMGIHYVMFSRVGDPTERGDQPELVIYAPGKDGKMKLVAVEYVVVAQAWADAGHTAAPSLFGRTFTLVPEGNRYGLPPFYELHAWVWDHNKSGMFADYNPNVVCP